MAPMILDYSLWAGSVTADEDAAAAVDIRLAGHALEIAIIHVVSTAQYAYGIDLALEAASIGVRATHLTCCIVAFFQVASFDTGAVQVAHRSGPTLVHVAIFCIRASDLARRARVALAYFAGFAACADHVAVSIRADVNLGGVPSF